MNADTAFDARENLSKLLEIWRFSKNPPHKYELKDIRKWKSNFEKWYMDNVFDQAYADDIFYAAKEVMDELPDDKRPPILSELARKAAPRVPIQRPAPVLKVVANNTPSFKERVQSTFDSLWSRWRHDPQWLVPEAVGLSCFRSVCTNEEELQKVIIATEFYLKKVYDEGEYPWGFKGFFTQESGDAIVWKQWYHRATNAPKGVVTDTFEIVWSQYPKFRGKSIQKDRARSDFSFFVKNADDCVKVVAAVRAYCAERYETSENEKTLEQYTSSFSKFMPSWKEQDGLEEELGKMLAEQFVEVYPKLVTGLYDPAPYLTMILKQGKTMNGAVLEVAEFFASMTKTEFDASQSKLVLRRALRKALGGIKTYRLG